MENQKPAIDPHQFPTFKKNEYNFIFRFPRTEKKIHKLNNPGCDRGT